MFAAGQADSGQLPPKTDQCVRHAAPCMRVVSGEYIESWPCTRHAVLLAVAVLVQQSGLRTHRFLSNVSLGTARKFVVLV